MQKTEMTRRNPFWFLLLAAFLTFACASKSGSNSSMGEVPANMRSFESTPPTVWKALMDTIQYDFLIPIEVAEKGRGYFSSELMKDYQPNSKSKYRLSGTIMFDGESTIVKLYKQLQFEQQGEWITIPSDLRMEMEILQKVGRRLDAM